MKILKIASKVLFYVMFVFVIIFFIFSLFLNDNYFCNYKMAIVLSGSMEPTLSVDDLVIIKKTDNYKEGDIITFKDANEMVMHRIIEIDDDTIITQGDANNVADTPITKDKVDGVYVGKIVLLGNIISFIKTPFGLCMFILLSILLLILTIFDFDDSKKSKLKIIISVLIFLIILISSFVIGCKAKYKSEVISNDTGVIASFIKYLFVTRSEVTDGILDINIANIVEDEYDGSDVIEFEISNKKDDKISEVSQNISIVVDFSDEIPDKLSLKLLDDSNQEIECDKLVESNQYIFENVYEFKAGVYESKDYKLQFVFDDAKEDFSVDNVNIRVKTVQVD